MERTKVLHMGLLRAADPGALIGQRTQFIIPLSFIKTHQFYMLATFLSAGLVMSFNGNNLYIHR